MPPEMTDVLIVEDENQLAALHAEMVKQHPHLRLVGMAATLADAERQIRDKRPHLVLLDNYLRTAKALR